MEKLRFALSSMAAEADIGSPQLPAGDVYNSGPCSPQAGVQPPGGVLTHCRWL